MDLMKALEASATHLRDHWRAYLPAVAVLAAMSVLAMGGIIAWAVSMGVATAALEWDEALVQPLIGLGGAAGMLAFFVALAPLSLYLARLTTAIEDEAPAPGLPGIGESLVAMLLSTVTLTAYLAGTMMCVLPGLIVLPATMFAYASHALEGGGVIKSIGRSIATFRKAPLEVFVYSLLLQVIASGFGSIPVIGFGLAIPVISVGMVMAWRQLEA